MMLYSGDQFVKERYIGYVKATRSRDDLVKKGAEEENVFVRLSQQKKNFIK